MAKKSPETSSRRDSRAPNAVSRSGSESKMDLAGVDEKLLEIRDHEGEGYKPLVDHAGWRVAILRFQDGLLAEQQSSMEGHLETDEVFVLTKGEGTLII